MHRRSQGENSVLYSEKLTGVPVGLGLGKFHNLSLSFLLRNTGLLTPTGSAAVRLKERTYVVTLGERGWGGQSIPASSPSTPGRKPESREAKGWGCRPCPDMDPTLSETVPSPAGAYPGLGIRFGGLLAARYSSEGVGTGRNATKALGAAPPEEESRVGGRRPRLSPPRASPTLAPPPRTTSSPGAHPAAGTGCSFAPVPPARPRSHFPFAPFPHSRRARRRHLV